MTIFELYGSIGLQDNGFKKGINEATNAGKSFTTSVKGIIGTVAGLKVVQLAFNAVKDSVTAAMNRIDTMEQFNRTMTVMTGSAGDASAALADITDVVTGTGYGLTTAASAVQGFVTSGMQVDSATGHIKGLADAVSFYGDGTNATLEGVSQAWSKMATSGKVYSTDVQSLLNAGIPVWDIYSEAVGMSVAEVQKATSDGTIKAKEFQDTLITALNEGAGRFPSITGAAQEAGASWSGTFDNMQADVTKATTNIMQDIDKSLVNGGLPSMREGLRMTSKSFASFLEGAGSVFANLLKVAAPAAKTVSQNLDVVAVAAGGVTVAFAAHKVITTWSKAMGASKAVLASVKIAQDAYTASMTKNLGVKSASIATEQFQTVVIGKGTMARATQLAAEKLGTTATGENTVARAASVGVVGLQTAVMNVLTTSTSAQSAVTGVAKVAWEALNATMRANPVLMVVGGIAALATGIFALTKAMAASSTQYDDLIAKNEELATSTYEAIDALNSSIDSFSESERTHESNAQSIIHEAESNQELADKLFALQEEIQNGIAAGKNMDAQIRQSASMADTLSGRVDNLSLSVDGETGALNLNEAQVRESIKAAKEYAKAKLDQARTVGVIEQIVEAENNRWEVEQKVKSELAELAKIQDIVNNSFMGAAGANAKLNGTYGDTKGRLEELLLSLGATDEQLTSLDYDSANFDAQVNELLESLAQSDPVLAALRDRMDESAEAAGNSSDALSGNTEELAILSDQWGMTAEQIQAAADASGLSVTEWGEAQQKAADDAAAKLESYTTTATNMFGIIEANSAISVGTMTGNLLKNQEIIRGWSDNLVTLGNRGVNQGILDILKEAGPESANYVAELVNASDQELAELSTAFESGTTEATETLRKVLGLPETTESGADMVDDIAESALKNKALVTASEQIVIDAKNAAIKQVSASNFANIGENMMSGIVNGINSGRSGVVTAMVSAINQAHSAAKAADDQHSPSKWWEGFALNSMAGWAGGVEKGTKSVVGEIVDAAHKVEDAAFMPDMAASFAATNNRMAQVQPVPAYNNAPQNTYSYQINQNGIDSNPQSYADAMYHALWASRFVPAGA